MSSDIRPSNLKQLPLETYMIPITKVNPSSVKEKVESAIDTKKDEIISYFQAFQDFQNMSSKQQANYMVLQYHKTMSYLRSTTDIIDAYETVFITFLAESLSSKTNTVNDITIIKRNFILLLNVSLSCCIVYNWYYLMFFLDETGNRIDSYKFSLQTLQEKQPIVHVIFKYTLCVLSILTHTLMNTIPSTLKTISVNPKINRMIQFIFLFLFVILIITVFGKSILDLVGSVEFVGFFCIAFVLYGIYTFAIEFTDKDPFVITSRMRKYTAFGQITPFLYMLLFFVRILWSISTIFITALSNFFYLIFTSFFAMTCYSDKSLYTTISMIHKFVRNETEQSEKKGKEETFFKNVFNFFIEYLYMFLFEFILILTLVISLLDYSLKMNDTKKLQIIMTSFCSTLIFLLCFIVFQRFTSIKKTFDLSKSMSAATPMSYSSTPIPKSTFVTPIIPTIPAISTIPTLPTIPAIPTIPTLPAIPTIPILPTLPAMPILPTIPPLLSNTMADNASKQMTSFLSDKSKSITSDTKSPKKILNTMMNILRKK